MVPVAVIWEMRKEILTVVGFVRESNINHNTKAYLISFSCYCHYVYDNISFPASSFGGFISKWNGNKKYFQNNYPGLIYGVIYKLPVTDIFKCLMKLEEILCSETSIIIFVVM